jgi:cellulose synthase/poly-beta-1,6-N-acetylglucosamine synthase-like glycosyltransferase
LIGGIIPAFSHQLGLSFMNMIKGNAFIAGSGEAVRKKTLVELGGWRSGALTEDIEYSFRLMKNNKRIVYLENLLCECEAPFTIKDLCKQQMRWGYGVIAALKTHLKGTLFNKKIPASWKLNPLILLSGYLITFLFFSLLTIGVLSFISAEPAPIVWGKLFSETALNLLITSGYLATSVIMLLLLKKAREIPRMIAASFTVGLMVIYYVVVGISRSVFNRGMQWFILSKKGNEV